jgi:hypothetical protein
VSPDGFNILDAVEDLHRNGVQRRRRIRLPVQGLVDLVLCPGEGLTFRVHECSALLPKFDATLVARGKPRLNFDRQKQIALTKA